MKEKPYKNKVFMKVFHEINLFIINYFRSDVNRVFPALLLRNHKGRQGGFPRNIKNRPFTPGRSWKKKGPAEPGLFSGSLQ